MDEPVNPDTPEKSDASAQAGTLRELAENVLLAGLGLLDAAREQAAGAVGAAGGGPQLRERAQNVLAGLAADLGFVSRDRYEELELKVAQLEHRVRLLEGGETPSAAPAEPAPAPSPES